MSYVTPAQLADGSDAAKELAELYSVELALLVAVIEEADTSAWEPADVAIAEAALASIERFCAQADGEVDARLAIRGYTLPQDPEQFPVLTVWARAIARYHLNRMRDRTSEDTGRIERDYRDAIRALDAVAAGKLSLGAGDPLALAPDGTDEGAVRVQSNERMFTRDSLRRL